MDGKKIIIIGPAYPLRGGLASYNERLAREFMREGHEVEIFTFSLQYPSFLFPGKTQYSEDPAPSDLKINVCINSVNPFNWLTIGLKLRKIQPDILVVRYWLPFMGPSLGTILRFHKKSKRICIVDNIIPHEKRPFDKLFTNYFVKSVDGFVTMSEEVKKDLKSFTLKPAVYVMHPVYDGFGAAIAKNEAYKLLGLDPNFKYFLFFGFIRAYKGLDVLFRAIAILKQRKASLLAQYKFIIAGEFYEAEEPYLALINELGIADSLILKTDFIPDSQVKNYFSAAELVIQPYKHATQSGITPLAYFYERPTLVTDVGALAKFVIQDKTGLICEPNAEAIAASIERFSLQEHSNYQAFIMEEKKKLSWDNITNAIMNLAK